MTKMLRSLTIVVLLLVVVSSVPAVAQQTVELVEPKVVTTYTSVIASTVLQQPEGVYVGTFGIGRLCVSDDQCQFSWPAMTLCPESSTALRETQNRDGQPFVPWVDVMKDNRCVDNRCVTDIYRFFTCEDAGIWPPPGVQE